MTIVLLLFCFVFSFFSSSILLGYFLSFFFPIIHLCRRLPVGSIRRFPLGFIPTLVRAFLCPSVGPMGIKLAIHITFQ